MSLPAEHKKLIFRCWHRGTREIDLLLGTFADVYVPTMNDAELALFAEFLTEQDPDIYDWVIGRASPPAQFAGIVAQLRQHHGLGA